MKLIIRIETEEVTCLTHYRGIIIVANGSRRREYSFEYTNPFPSEARDDKLLSDNFKVSGGLSDRLTSLLKEKVYLNITDNQRTENGQIVSKEEVMEKLGEELLGWVLA